MTEMSFEHMGVRYGKTNDGALVFDSRTTSLTGIIRVVNKEFPRKTQQEVFDTIVVEDARSYEGQFDLRVREMSISESSFTKLENGEHVLHLRNEYTLRYLISAAWTHSACNRVYKNVRLQWVGGILTITVDPSGFCS